jgi:hypothetical protein
MTIHLSILLFWAAARAARRAPAARRRRGLALVGALVPLGYAVVLVLDFERRAAGCST